MDDVMNCDECPNAEVCKMYEPLEVCYFGYTEGDFEGAFDEY